MPFVALFVIYASLHSGWTLTLLALLCSYIVKQRIFVVPHSKSSPTPHTHTSESPRSCSLAGLPPLLPQSRMQMKNLWPYALKTSHSIWSAAVPLMMPPLMAPSVGQIFSSRWGCDSGRKRGTCPRWYAPLPAFMFRGQVFARSSPADVSTFQSAGKLVILDKKTKQKQNQSEINRQFLSNHFGKDYNNERTCTL